MEARILVLMALMAGVEAFMEIERFGKGSRRCAGLRPSRMDHRCTTRRDIFAAPDFEAFQKGFGDRVARFIGVPGGHRGMAIDGGQHG